MMCRMLITNNTDSWMVQAETRMYVHLCSLPVEMYIGSCPAADLKLLESRTRFDILVTSVARNDRDYEFVRAAHTAQPWLKNIFILRGSQNTPPQKDRGNSCFISVPIRLDDFYEAFSRLDPETARVSAGPPTKYGRLRDCDDFLLKRIHEILSMIESGYQDDIGLESIADKICIAPCHLSSQFSRFMGTSLSSCINDYRLQRAALLLSETQILVQDICFQVGYHNPAYFCTSFKKKYHMTPAQFRVRNKAA